MLWKLPSSSSQFYIFISKSFIVYICYVLHDLSTPFMSVLYQRRVHSLALAGPQHCAIHHQVFFAIYTNV
jgi:hypothetical protein